MWLKITGFGEQQCLLIPVRIVILPTMAAGPRITTANNTKGSLSCVPHHPLKGWLKIRSKSCSELLRSEEAGWLSFNSPPCVIWAEAVGHLLARLRGLECSWWEVITKPVSREAVTTSSADKVGYTCMNFPFLTCIWLSVDDLSVQDIYN